MTTLINKCGCKIRIDEDIKTTEEFIDKLNGSNGSHLSKM
jgi:hypothetical protein